ncbi:MAG: hypothetical protein V1663_02845 [archaeon]
MKKRIKKISKIKKSNKIKKTNKVSKFVYWTPRILSILFLLFLALFSLDVFDSKMDFWGTVLGLLIHNIPVFILLAIVIISWKYEWVGGIVFILAGLFYIFLMILRALKNPNEWDMLSYSFIIAGPAFFIGILFLIGWFKKKK